MGSLIATLAWCSPASAHVVEPGDELVVVIPRVDPERRKVEVALDGTIALDLYGKVPVAGLDLAGATDAVKRALRRYLTSVGGVSVVLSEAGRLVFVTGAVAKPGLVRLPVTDGPWEAIQKAGGPADGAALQRVRLVRADGERTLDVRAYLTGAGAGLPELRAGDVVFVPADAAYPGGADAPWAAYLGSQALLDKVVVMGAVHTPGLYQRAPGLTPLTAIALAGGALPEADMGNVRLLTVDGSHPVDLLAGLADPTALAARDPLPEGAGAIVYVPHRIEGGLNPLGRSVNVIGAVRQPGPVDASGPLALVDAVALAGGPEAQAALGRVHVLRRGARWTLAARYDLEDGLKAGGVAGLVRVWPGDTVAIDARPEVWRTVVQVISDLAILSTSIVLLTRINR